MLDICIKVSKGEEIWNLKTNKCDVLYLALEDTYQRLQKRLFINKKLQYNNNNRMRFIIKNIC